MKRNLAQLSSIEYDLVVVGGGAFGACAAWEAASRGLSVALVEKSDFCSATSANHLKVVHGGIRYLQHLDFHRVRESCRERTALLRIAPHLVQPLPIVMPTYGRGMDGQSVLRAGFLLYDLLTLGRNSGIRDVDRHIPAGRMLSRDRCLTLYPSLARDDLTGAGLFYDAQFHNPPRLALAFLQSAVSQGACVANYAEVTEFLRKDSRVFGVEIRDRLTGDQFEVRARTVLNSSGPWAAELLRDSLRVRLSPQPMFSRDAGFVVRGRRTGDYALACRVQTSDPDAILSRKGRHVMVIPWRDHTLFGSWHTVHTRSPDDFEVCEDELQGFIEEINSSDVDLGIRREDVSMVYAGLTLFGENVPGQRNLRFGHRSMLIDHAAEHGIEGLVTMIGVRATTARGMGQKAIDLVLKKSGQTAGPSRTAEIPIHGGDIRSFEALVKDAATQHGAALGAERIRALIHNYGTEYGAVLKYAADIEAYSQPIGSSQTLKAEVIHAVREEMAMTLGDTAFRRTDLATGGHPGEDTLAECARLMAAEHGWDDERVRREMDAVRSRFPS
jgi:glycerol-3-phosphate dehydrogenase